MSIGARLEIMHSSSGNNEFIFIFIFIFHSPDKIARCTLWKNIIS